MSYIDDITFRVIKDGYGNTVESRKTVQFAGSTVVDDEAGDKTIVSINSTGGTNLAAVLLAGNSAHNRITNLEDPIDAQDATTKTYVDAKAASIVLSDVLDTDNTTKGYNINLTGGSYLHSSDGNVVVNDTLNVSSNKIINLLTPTLSTDAANKGYVDSVNSLNTLAQVLGYGNSAGTSNILMNNHKISELATPTLAQDAVNKTYVDGYMQSQTLATILAHGNNAGTNVIDMNNQPIQNVYALTNYVTGQVLMDSTLNMNGKTLTNLITPTADSDAATKAYVDSFIAGGTLSVHAATKEYVDGYMQNQTLAAVLARGNSAGTTDIDMNGKTIQNVYGLTNYISGQVLMDSSLNMGNHTLVNVNSISGNPSTNLDISSTANINMTAGANFVAQGVLASITSTGGTLSLNGGSTSGTQPVKVNASQFNIAPNGTTYQQHTTNYVTDLHRAEPTISTYNIVGAQDSLFFCSNGRRFSINRHQSGLVGKNTVLHITNSNFA